MEDNNNGENVTLNTESKVVVNKVTGFTVDEKLSENINTNSLAANSTAKLVGNFIPDVLGIRKLTATFKYAEGKDIPISSETKVIQVQLSVALDPSVSLPDKVALNCDHEVTFLIKNETELDATAIQINTTLLNDVKILEEEPVNDGYKAGHAITIEDFNTKNDNKLDPNHQYRVTGKLNTEEQGAKDLTLLVKHKELESLKEGDENKNGVKFEKTITIETVKIAPSVEGLPVKIKLGESADVIFSFTNESADFSATNVKIEITQEGVS